MQIRKLPADVARCEGRDMDHPKYLTECCRCMRKLSPPHEYQVWMGPWQPGHGECPEQIPLDS